MAVNNEEIKRLSMAIKNVYGIITRKKLNQVSENAISKEIVVTNQRAAEVAVTELKSVVPNIDADGINIYAFTLQQREALKDLITRTLLYQKIKEYKGGTVTLKPIEFNIDSVNPFTDIYNATQLQNSLLPGQWVNDHVMFFAPTLNLKLYLNGTQPLNYGWDQSRLKPANVGAKDGNFSYDISNLGFNIMPVDGWFNYIGYSDSQTQYSNGNRVTPRAEQNTGIGSVGVDRRNAVKYETVFGSPIFSQTSMIFTGEYFWRKSEREIETNQDPTIHSQGYNVGLFQTNVFGPIGLGGYLNQEYGSIATVEGSDFGFKRTMWGAKAAITGLSQNFRYKLSAFAETGIYTQGTISGRVDGELRNPARPSLSPLFRTPSQDRNGQTLFSQDYDQAGKGWSAELEYLNKGGFAPIIFKLGGKDYLYMRNEPVWKYNIGLAYGKWVGVDYSLIYNNVPEIASFSEGKPRDLTHRLDGFIYLDLMGIGAKATYGKGAESPMNAGLRLSGWYMKDDHTPHKPSCGVSLSLEVGFSTGITKKTRDVERVVCDPKFYDVVEESPNNRAMIENYYDRRYTEARQANKLLEDGMLIRSNP